MSWFFWRRKRDKPHDRFGWLRPTPEVEDDGFDSTGFLVGLASGIPVSPTQGISTGAMLGATPTSSTPDPTLSFPDPKPDPAPTYSAPDPTPTSDPSPSYDSGTSTSTPGC